MPNIDEVRPEASPAGTAQWRESIAARSPAKRLHTAYTRTNAPSSSIKGRGAITSSRSEPATRPSTQAGSSLTLFAERNVDRHVFGWEMGAATTQFFNPAYILLFGSLFSIMWVELKKRNRDFTIPMKFGLGILQLGLGYLIVLVAAPLAIEYKVPLWTLAVLYMLHTTGELFLSPIGLSMVTKLVPKDMTGTAMGAWFLSIAGANYAAGLLARLTGVEHGGGEEGTVDAAASLASYLGVYSTMGWVTVGIGLLLMVLSPLINRLFHGIN